MTPRLRDFQRWGAKGGAAVDGEKKRRGDREYYAALGRKGAAAKRQRKEAKTLHNSRSDTDGSQPKG